MRARHRMATAAALGFDMYMCRAQYVHMKELTLTELRRNIFKLVDEALATGEPIIVKRKGRTVTLTPETEDCSTSASRDEDAWAKFWAEPPDPAWEGLDLSFEALDKASKAYWQWDAEVEPRR
jgi:prevent-host-death family protein